MSPKVKDFRKAPSSTADPTAFLPGGGWDQARLGSLVPAQLLASSPFPTCYEPGPKPLEDPVWVPTRGRGDPAPAPG